MTTLLALSLDSFVGAFALGLLGMPSKRNLRIATIFGLADGLATFIGSHLNFAIQPSPRGYFSLSIMIVVCIFWVSVFFLSPRIFETRTGTQRFAVSFLPLLLSVDNLFARGISQSTGFAGYFDPITSGLISATLAYLGFEISSWLGSLAREKSATKSGIAFRAMILFR